MKKINFSFPRDWIQAKNFIITFKFGWSFVHVSLSKEEDTKFGKIEWLYKCQRTLMKKYYYPSKSIAIDEQMVSFQDRIPYSLLQYMPCKPTPWGFKLFVLAEFETGYTLDFMICNEKGISVTIIAKGLL